jgi:hypothetical protein
MNDVGFVIAIPSYKRPHTLVQNTLAYLKDCGVPNELIHIFLVDGDCAEYGNAIGGQGYFVHYGPLGLHHMRNYITDFFPEGTKILHIDDDIRYMVYMEEDLTVTNKKSCRRYPLKRLMGPEFLSWVESAFNALEMSDPNTKLFGIYPLRNGYFMKSLPWISTDLRFCVGSVWGCINDKRIRITIQEKEDYERTLLVFELFGSVLRYNHIAPVTSYYTTPGGMQSQNIDRIEASKVSCSYLLERFPDLCKLGKRKKSSGIHEIDLIRKH